MNILFLTISRINNLKDRGIYTDLMNEFIIQGHNVFIASPTERRFGKPTHLIENGNCQILKVKTLNIQKTNVLEKGVGTLLLELQFNRAINKYWGNIKFDLVLSATPPITFNKVIEKIKARCSCRSYLMLKDIFPQNAVDLGMIREGGILHKLFRKKEERLYEISDTIGCMSPANCTYILKHNPFVNPSKVELCPNAIKPTNIPLLTKEDKHNILLKFNIPTDKTIFIYGGNLGKPQGIDFLLNVVEANEKRSNSYIVIVGSGTEFDKIATWFEKNKPKNSILLTALPQDEYDNLVRACDVGLIFLDPRFTIPNFPSRLLSYLENSMPVLLATDTNTDIGKIAQKEGFGLWCKSGDIEKFFENMNQVLRKNEISKMGNLGYKYLLSNYTINNVGQTILKHLQ